MVRSLVRGSSTAVQAARPRRKVGQLSCGASVLAPPRILVAPRTPSSKIAVDGATFVVAHQMPVGGLSGIGQSSEGTQSHLPRRRSGWLDLTTNPIEPSRPALSRKITLIGRAAIV
jgi:hypothetical protein